MPKRPDAENILAKFRSVSLDKSVQHTGFEMYHHNTDADGNRQFRVEYHAIVTVPSDTEDDTPEVAPQDGITAIDPSILTKLQ